MQTFLKVMFDLMILLTLLLLIIPTIISIPMSCYSNARLILPSSAIRYDYLTFQSCQCLMSQQNISGFQYDSNNQSCYTFGNDSSRSNLRVEINSQVCFINRTSTSYPTTTTVVTTLPSPPITISTSASSNSYHTKEIISLTNNVSLTSLSIVITVPKSFGVYNPTSFTQFWGDTTNNTINQTNDSVIFSFEMISGQTIVAGQWQVGVDFDANVQGRSTSNDTYIIRIQSYQEVFGHF